MEEDPLKGWHLNPVSNKDYDFIDGLRGIAILLVLMCHFSYLNPASGRAAHFMWGLCNAGSSGVTLFFALSGFLISWPFWKRKINEARPSIPPGYGQRRFFKIYPPLALSILLLTPIYIFRTGHFDYLRIASQWLLGFPLFMPVSGKLNPVMWSLIVEIQFYLVLPLTMLLLKRISTRTCLWLIPTLFATVGIGRRLVHYWLHGSGPIDFSVLNFPFPSDLDVFSLGILMAGLHSLGRIKPVNVYLGYVGVLLFAALFPISAWLTLLRPQGLQWEAEGLTTKIACGLILFFVADPQCLAARLLCSVSLRWCGIISYEWYLFHQPIVLWTRASSGPANGHLAKLIAVQGSAFFASVILAASIYWFFSLPILRQGRRTASV